MTTVPNERTGQKMAKELIEEKLAACVTISASCQSYYRWLGKISRDLEHTLFIKTRADLYPSLEKKILMLHPYEVPEILALPVVKGYGKYLGWLAQETDKKRLKQKAARVRIKEPRIKNTGTAKNEKRSKFE